MSLKCIQKHSSILEGQSELNALAIWMKEKFLEFLELKVDIYVLPANLLAPLRRYDEYPSCPDIPRTSSLRTRESVSYWARTPRSLLRSTSCRNQWTSSDQLSSAPRYPAELKARIVLISKISREICSSNPAHARKLITDVTNSISTSSRIAMHS